MPACIAVAWASAACFAAGAFLAASVALPIVLLMSLKNPMVVSSWSGARVGSVVRGALLHRRLGHERPDAVGDVRVLLHPLRPADGDVAPATGRDAVSGHVLLDVVGAHDLVLAQAAHDPGVGVAVDALDRRERRVVRVPADLTGLDALRLGLELPAGLGGLGRAAHRALDVFEESHGVRLLVVVGAGTPSSAQGAGSGQASPE